MMCTRNWRRWGAISMTSLALAACVNAKFKTNEPLHGFVLADEPRAAQIGRDILQSGGMAADAATAMALTMAVTLPSRVGLAGGGVCLVFDATKKTTRTLDFLPRAAPPGNTVAAPALLRAMAVLHAGLGKSRWERVTVPAEQEAVRGAQLSTSLAADLARFPAAARDGAEAWIPGGRTPTEGTSVTQIDLAGALSLIRRRGVGAFYDGPLSPAVAKAVGVSTATLAAYQPIWRDTVSASVDHYDLHFPTLPEETSGQTLLNAWLAGEKAGAGKRYAAAANALGVGAGAGAGDAAPGASLLVIDGLENAVACALTMGAPFGTGKLIPGTGILTAKPVSDARFGTAALLTNAIVGRTRFGVVGTAQGGDGPHAAALSVLRMALPGTLDEEKAPALVAARDDKVPGRVAVVTCQASTENLLKICQVGTDPRVPSLGYVIETDPKEAREP